MKVSDETLKACCKAYTDSKCATWEPSPAAMRAALAVLPEHSQCSYYASRVESAEAARNAAWDERDRKHVELGLLREQLEAIRRAGGAIVHQWDCMPNIGDSSAVERMRSLLKPAPAEVEPPEPPPDVWAAIDELRDGLAMTARALAHAEDEKGLYVVSAARRHGLLQLCDALDAARKARRG